MAAKKTIYLNAAGPIREVRQTDADKMKKAFQKMFEDYLDMKKCQHKFEDSLGELCMILQPWTIPRRWVAPKMKELQRGGVRRG